MTSVRPRGRTDPSAPDGMRPAARVTARDFPSATAMDPRFVARAGYQDAYTVRLRDDRATPVELFHAVFAHRPGWMKAVMIARNALASRAGLQAPSAGEILRPKTDGRFEVGDSIGSWPIYASSPVELVAGRDNAHLDFRLSVLRETGPDGPAVVVSTACAVNNAFGRAYLAVILPFHRRGLRWLIASASAAGRL